MIGLKGRPHPALSMTSTAHEVKKARCHLKMMSGDYFTYDIKAKHSGGSPLCRSCEQKENEDIIHILARCKAFTELRERIKIEYEKHCSETKTKINFEKVCEDDKTFCQFVLDPSSINLKDRVSNSDPILNQIFQTSRDFCFAIHSQRMKILEQKSRLANN